MNKGDLTKKIATQTGYSEKSVRQVINALAVVITEALAEGKKVRIMGFGTFEARHRAERKGRNPATGEEMVIPARRVPGFRAGKNFKESVREAI